MAYELYIWPDEKVPKVTGPEVVAAFVKAGLQCTEQPDQSGHWLVLEGYESALNLTLKEGVATEDDEAIIQQVADVFKSLGWSVSDDEGML